MKLNFNLLSEQEKENEADFLAEHMDDEVAAVRLMDDDEADEALARLIWARDKAKNIDAVVKAKKAELMDQLKAYEKRLKGSIENYASFQADLLYSYLTEKLKDKDGKVQKGSIKLFNGTVGLKEPVGSLKIQEGKEEELIGWLKKIEKTELINTTEAVDKAKFKKAFSLDPSGHYFMYNDKVIQGVEFDKPDQFQLNITKPRTRKEATGAA